MFVCSQKLFCSHHLKPVVISVTVAFQQSPTSLCSLTSDTCSHIEAFSSVWLSLTWGSLSIFSPWSHSLWSPVWNTLPTSSPPGTKNHDQHIQSHSNPPSYPAWFWLWTPATMSLSCCNTSEPVNIQNWLIRFLDFDWQQWRQYDASFLWKEEDLMHNTSRGWASGPWGSWSGFSWNPEFVTVPMREISFCLLLSNV